MQPCGGGARADDGHSPGYAIGRMVADIGEDAAAKHDADGNEREKSGGGCDHARSMYVPPQGPLVVRSRSLRELAATAPRRERGFGFQYKTEICTYWATGCCHKGRDLCNFAHGEGDLANSPPPWDALPIALPACKRSTAAAAVAICAQPEPVPARLGAEDKSTARDMLLAARRCLRSHPNWASHKLLLKRATVHLNGQLQDDDGFVDELMRLDSWGACGSGGQGVPESGALEVVDAAEFHLG